MRKTATPLVSPDGTDDTMRTGRNGGTRRGNGTSGNETPGETGDETMSGTVRGGRR